MKPDTQTRILDAALSEFSLHGWQGATTREIARVAGVNEVTLFRHFENKQNLLVEVIRRFVRERQKILEEAEEKEAPLEEMLGRIAALYQDRFNGCADFLRVSLAEYARNPDQVREVLAGVVKPMRDQFLRILRERQKRGEIRRDMDCEVALDLFVGMLFSRAVKPHLVKVSYTDNDYRKSCVDFFMRGTHP